MATVAQTIKSITRDHLVNGNGLLFSQCTTAVGWIGGTVPDDIPENKGIIELPTSDVSNSGIVVGAALVGKRPIYVIRYQGFTWFNAAMLVNYAAKSKALWNVPCPVFVRALGMEGSIGPVASNMHHGMIMRMPGIKVVAPMTPKEWQAIWNDYMSSDDPFYCSESRFSFQIDYEIEDSIVGSDITIFSISTGRLNSIIAAKELNCNLINLVYLKPTIFSQPSLDALRKSKFGIVVDSDYSIAGTSRSIAYELMHLTGVPVFALGLDDKTAGFAPHADNITPTPTEIINFVKQALARAS